MNLLQRIGNAIISFGKDDLEPWLKGFLTGLAHAEIQVATEAAQTFVEQALPALTAAAISGNWSSFVDTQAEVVKQTAAELEKNAEKVAVTSVTTAVNALIVAHPMIQAATAKP